MWQNLKTIQKILFVVAISIAVPFAPELIVLADLGGIELVLSFLVLYYKPLLLRLDAVYRKVKAEFYIGISGIKYSAMSQPKVFTIQAAFSCIALMFTGSFIYAAVFFMPAMLFNGVLV
ncbi:hypothetical protein [Thalassotalea fusca]